MPMSVHNPNTSHTQYNALGNRTSYAYDRYGNLSAVTNPLGNAVVYEYDLRGRRTYEGGAIYPVRYTYDVFGNKTTMTTYRNESLGPTSGDVTTWRYDEASNCMTNKVYADGKGPRYGYTQDGKLAQRIWARGIVTGYSYDGWGSLTNTVYSDGTSTVTLLYDAMGRQTNAVDAAGVTTFRYDDYGSLTNETVVGAAGENTIVRHWDSYGRTTGYSLVGRAAPSAPQRQTTIGYDLVTGRIATMLASGSNVPFTWSYLPGSDLKSSLAYPNGLTASWAYDAIGQLLQVRNAVVATAPSPSETEVISQYDYVYDNAGRRVSCAKSGSSFTQNDALSYGYNEKSELTNAVAAVDSDYRYAYDFDEIGNRESANERGTNAVYMANQLNQYTAVDDFTPQFDDDGNQTLIKTATGIWSVTYNGENRPILWTCTQSNNQTITNNQTISMSYDRMGRRVTKNNQRFVYNGYLQIANFEQSVTNSQPTTYNHQLFIWDPTEPVATRPLVWLVLRSLGEGEYYTHDGNKNVSEVIASGGALVAHYDYAPFGAVTAQRGTSAASNPWRFSSEYAEDDTATVSYNYRHYCPSLGWWISRDPSNEGGGINLHQAFYNSPVLGFDHLGLSVLPDIEYYSWDRKGLKEYGNDRYDRNAEPYKEKARNSKEPDCSKIGPWNVIYSLECLNIHQERPVEFYMFDQEIFDTFKVSKTVNLSVTLKGAPISVTVTKGEKLTIRGTMHVYQRIVPRWKLCHCVCKRGTGPWAAAQTPWQRVDLEPLVFPIGKLSGDTIVDYGGRSWSLDSISVGIGPISGSYEQSSSLF